MAAVEIVEEMAAGQQTAVEPYMFEPESDPARGRDRKRFQKKSQQPRINMDVCQWLVVNIVT